MKLEKIHPNAIIPIYATDGSAAADLYSTDNYDLPVNARLIVKTGWKMALPSDHVGLINPKSGIAINKGVTVLNAPGTLDRDYRGEVGVIVINHSNDHYRIEKGQKIAQIMFVKYEQARFNIVESLDNTSRGDGGFGSTGVK
ncbi:MAG: dUTP diphosphatase [Nanoarchaeota archaeon]|nr:dUTP diphosphatase [Nanoarchaeota archaeon]